jgi:1-acyl-sn-glycerol-3-phosphate acyltransferase
VPDRAEIQRERTRRLRIAAGGAARTGDHASDAGTQVPIEEVPIEEVPVEKVPVEDVPVQQAPAQEGAIEEVPAEVAEVPIEVDDTPIEIEVEAVAPAPEEHPGRPPHAPSARPRERRRTLDPFGFVSAVADGLGRGLDLSAALEAAAGLLPPPARSATERIAARLRGDYAQDEWGYDEEFVELIRPFLEFMYDRWWRVQAIGVDNVPAHGPAMIVANHAGVLPWDATMMSMAILKKHPLPRTPRFTVLDWAFRLPWVSGFMRRVGGVVASPYNAMRLLEQGHLVMVFPEGSKGAGKPFSERYRLQRFGRGGFVEIALRAGSPIVPVAVVGSEEIYPKVGESRLLARLLGAPYFPITPTFPALGPLGAVPLPSRWRIEFCPPFDLSGYGPEAAEDRPTVFELSERVRDTIQHKVLENLVKRGSAFL